MDIKNHIQQAISKENLKAHLEWFSKVRRDTGGPGEDKAAAYLSETLEKNGVPHEVHEFDAFLSYPRDASVQINGADSVSLPALTHSFAQSTPAAGVTGNIVLGEASKLGEATGKIVVVDGLCTPATVLEGSQAGVKALIFVNQDRVIHNMISTTIWGTPTLDEIHRLPQIPVVSVNKESGEKLKALLKNGDVNVTVKSVVETGWYRSKLPEVRIQGEENAETFVLVGGHYCSWEYGITDNATGDALLLEMARILNDDTVKLKRSVRICWWPGHSHGRYSGSTWYADTFFDDLSNHCVTYHNIDSPGVRGATKYVARHTTAEMEAFCISTIADLTGQTEPPIHRPSRAADQSFLANGVPAFSTYPFLPQDHEDYRPWTGGCANAYWWHSSEDTLDKADVDILSLDALISTSAVYNLCNAETLPLAPETAAANFLAFATELNQIKENNLPTNALLESAKALSDSAGKLAGFRNKVTKANAAKFNEAILKLCRTTVSLTYSKGGRYSHDPAAWSPIMRNSKSSVYPGLNAAFHLHEMKDNADAYGFAKAGIIRQINRATEELRAADKLAKTFYAQLNESSTISA